MMNKPRISRVSWNEANEKIRSIREQVFIIEQHVPVALEWDGLDKNAIHVLAEINDVPAGTGRLLTTGQIGRMAVLKKYRGLGLGSGILTLLMAISRQEKIGNLYLNAQKQAVSFYTKYGFTQTGDYFDDAGIVHCRMIYSS